MKPRHHSHALAAAVSCVAATALLTPSAFALASAASLAAPLQECISERDSLLSENAICEIAVHDELLAKWLEAQKCITDNLADAIRKDPLRADSLFGDYRFLLSQYRAEIGHYRDFPAFDRTKALNVREFGAAGDGIADDGPAIRKAIAAATAVAGP
ncbi:MAG: hypothetical protein IKO55_08960, partial [Kiritimatiellae bacterium]|nr:hypothetical protein [Kiritimatiellia bacterium]